MIGCEFSGIWWLPEDPDHTVAGNLLFAGDSRAELDLLGSFNDLGAADQFLEPNLILGVSTNGKRLSLYRCAQTNSSLSAPGILTSKYAVAVVFVGRHFQSEAELHFQKMACRYDRLPEWAWLSGFSFTIENDAESKVFKSFSVSYKHPDPHEVAVNGTRFRFHASFSRSGKLVEEHDLRQKLFVEIEPSQETSFDDFVDNLFRPLQNLISLGVGEPVFPLEMQGTLPAQSGQPDGPIRPDRVVRAYFSTPSTAEPGTSMHPVQMLFSFPAIKDNYEGYLTNWFDKVETIGPVLDLYFSTIYSSSMYLESRFLSLAQALETYHRRAFGGVYLAAERFDGVLRGLLEVIESKELSSEVTAAYRGKLQYLNEISLRRRVRSLAKALEEVVAPVIPDRRRFVSRVVDTRNYLTHYSADLEGRAASGEKLYVLTEQLKALLEMCLLQEIGFKDEVLIKLMAENPAYAHLARLAGANGAADSGA